MNKPSKPSFIPYKTITSVQDIINNLNETVIDSFSSLPIESKMVSFITAVENNKYLVLYNCLYPDAEIIVIKLYTDRLRNEEAYKAIIATGESIMRDYGMNVEDILKGHRLVITEGTEQVIKKYNIKKEDDTN